MKRRLLSLLALGALAASGIPLSANAGPSEGGISSDNVTYVRYVPFEVGTATGSRLIGKYLYVTSWRSFSIYDVSDAENPALLSTTPFATDGPSGGDAFRFENEDVATDGKVLVFSETTPRSNLYLYDVEDKTNPKLLSLTAGYGEHTMSCILRCKYLYGSSGAIIDIRNPKKPKKLGNWQTKIGLAGGAHDITEVRNGFVVTSPLSGPIQFLDVRNPVKPKVLASAIKPPKTPIIHSVAWPNQGHDRWLLVQAEQNVKPRCDDTTGGFMVFDTKGWQKTHTFTFVDQYKAVNGDFVDGSPPVNGLGCSAHWFETRDDFHNGGIVADGFYEHGTKWFSVAPGTGKLKEIGYFEPYGGSTSAAHWITHNIVYAVDYSRGLDILKFNDK